MVSSRILIIFAIFTIGICQAKIYSRCSFAAAMKANGVRSRAQLGTWTCIASHESNFNTRAVSATSDYGILQISAYYWCNIGSPGKGCGISCSSLLDDNINNDIQCAKKIYASGGFSQWTTYASCRGDQSRYIAGCNL